MSNPNNAVERRQKIREQMRQFYGDPNAAGNSASRRGQDGARRNPGVAPEMDLDSEYFNVTKYTTDLLRRETLKGLVESDTELLRSVRKLDGELQELVYRNYAKFISATDTIREMRDNVSQMDTKLQALSSNVTSIDEVSKGISDKLQEHHSRIESTITTNRMLKKIQFLVELPATMRQMLDRQEYGVCVKYWVAGDGFLTKHAAIPSIAKIQTECRGLAKQLYTQMEAAMCAVSLDDPEAMDSIRGYVENLRLLRATTLFTQDEQRRTEDSTSFEEAILKVLMGSVSTNFSKGVAAAQRDVRSSLVAPRDLATMELDKRGETLAQVSLREALAQLKSSCALLSVNSERVYSLLNKLDGSKVAMRVAQEVQPVLIDLLTPIAKHLGELAVAVFTSIGDEGLVTLDTPEVVGKALQSAVAALMRQMKHIAVTLKTLSANYLDTAHSHQSHAYAGMVDETLVEVLTTVARSLKEKSQEQPSRARLRAMVGIHVDADQNLTSSLAGTSAQYATALGAAAGVRNHDAQSQRLAFATSRWVYASFAAKVAEECASQLVQPEALAGERAAEALDRLSEAAHLLLHRGVLLVGQLEVTACAPVGFSNPAGVVDLSLSPAQGGGVHPALVALVRHEWPRLTAVLEALPPALPKDPPRSTTALSSGLGPSVGGMGLGAPASYTGRMFTASSTGRSSNPRSAAGPTGGAKGGKPTVSYTRNEDVTLQTNVDRIFSSRGANALSTMPRDGRPGTVMGGVVLYLLKGLVNYVREEVVARPYDQHAFQRLQVHATYLLRALLTPHKGTAPRQWIKAWGDSTTQAIQQQLNECCCCAYERYDAKVPLSNAALEKIVEEAASADVMTATTTATVTAHAGSSGSRNHAHEPAAPATVTPPVDTASLAPSAPPPPQPPAQTQQAAAPPPPLQKQQQPQAAAPAPRPAPAQPAAPVPAPKPVQRPLPPQHLAPSTSDGFRRMEDDDEDLPM